MLVFSSLQERKGTPPQPLTRGSINHRLANASRPSYCHRTVNVTRRSLIRNHFRIRKVCRDVCHECRQHSSSVAEPRLARSVRYLARHREMSSRLFPILLARATAWSQPVPFLPPLAIAVALLLFVAHQRRGVAIASTRHFPFEGPIFARPPKPVLPR